MPRRRELIITTPYFVPDESVLTALISAAHSGVEVTLILPEKNDSVLADYASRAVFDDLLAAGVRIAGFQRRSAAYQIDYGGWRIQPVWLG